MPRPRSPRRPAGGPDNKGPLRLGAWLLAFGMTKTTLSKGSGVSLPYISQMISGTKRNPSEGMLIDIADYLFPDVPEDERVSYLYRSPPDQTFVRTARDLNPDLLRRIMRKR